MKNLTFNFKSIVQTKARWLLTVIIFLTFSGGPIYGADVENGTMIYFDNSASGWNYSYTYFVINDTHGWKMTKITNTNLYVYKRTDSGNWTGYSYIRLAGNGTDFGEGQCMGGYDNMNTHLANFTNTYNNYGFGSGNLYYIKPDKGGSKAEQASLSVGHIGSSYTALNKTITVKAQVSTDNGTNHSETTSPATLSASSNEFSDYKTCGTSTSLSSNTISCGYTATTTLSVPTTDPSHYIFEGWYDASGNEQTKNKTLTIYPTSDATYYAYYKLEQHTVTYGVYENTRHGSVQLNSESAITTTDNPNINHGTAITFTATPASGYSVVGWYSDADCSSQLQEGGTTYTIASLTSPQSVYVKFTGALTLVAGTGGQVSLNNLDWKNDTIKKGIDNDDVVNIYASASSGYVFNTWERTSGTNGEITTNAEQGQFTSNTYADVTLTANFTETMYSVTVVDGTASRSTVGIATSVTVTADAAPSGKKFKEWVIIGRYKLLGAITSRVLELNATTDVTLTATYEDRETKKVYFAKPSTWTSGVMVYTWEVASKVGDEDPTNRNDEWPGVDITSNTETIAGVTYNYYEFYVDNDNEATPDDKSAWNRWDKIIFSHKNNAGTKTGDLTVADGHYYHSADAGSTGTISGSVSPEDWYVRGQWNNVSDWDYSHPVITNGTTSGSTIVRDLNAQLQKFKIYRASTNQWFKYCPTDDNNDVTADLANTMTLREYNSGDNTFTPSERTGYLFTLNTTITSNPTLSIAKLTDSDYSVTIQAGSNGSITTGPTTIHQYVSTAIAASPNTGYHFKNWTVDAAHSAYITFADATNASTKIYGTGSAADGAVITANFTNEGFVYVDLSAVTGDGKWGGLAPYVTYFNKTGWAWDGSTQALIVKNWLANDVHNQQMTRIGSSSVFCFHTSRTPEGKILFVNKSHPDANYHLVDMAASERGDFNVGEDNLFVVVDYVKKSARNTGYFAGYWMKYKEDTPGIKLCIYNGSHEHIYGSPFTLTKDEETGYFTTTINLTGETTYKIELLGDNGTYYKNSGTITGSIGMSPGWEYSEVVSTVGCINTTGGGEYTFTLNCTSTLRLGVTYPLASGDYRVVCNGKLATTEGDKTPLPSGSIKPWTSGSEKKDKVSFFVTDIIENENEVMDWNLILQSYDGSDWNNVEGKNNITFSALKGKTGVYTFDVVQTESGIEINNPQPYTGDYYIRTDKAEGGWESYKNVEDNRMIYSDWAATNMLGYDYYHCHYIKSGKNAKFVIANEYNPQITTECTTDDFVSDAYGNLPANANVRFMYNSATNEISRAYIGGSDESEYLNIVAGASDYVYLGNTDLYGADASVRKFEDLGNWVYEIEIKAYPGATGKVTAKYNNKTQHFIGTAETPVTIIGGETKGDKPYSLRAVFDFKDNHLVTAWIPEALEANLAINADVMLVREHQGNAQQITLAGHTLSEVKTVYGVMQFNKWTINNKEKEDPHNALYPSLTRYARDLYWISFPFNVNLRTAFGFGTYGTHWIIEYYDGIGRATNGFWADSPSNWKFVTPAMRESGDDGNGYILKANTGYILALDLDELGESSSVWDNTDDVSIYFPSKTNVNSITAKNVTVEFTDQSSYLCGINRGTPDGDRRIKDSYWHCIGVPSFAEYRTSVTDGSSTISWSTSAMPYLYEWNGYETGDNTLTAQSTSTFAFQPMYSYLVQYSGDQMVWTAATAPSSVAARLTENPDKEFQLALILEDEEQDHTYVRLTDDANVTNRFEFNYDLSKEYNAGRGNIWTVTADTVEVAGNSMPKPLQTTLVPVGVKVVANGEYTFSMPEGTNGEDVYLIDNAYGTRTNLGLMPYTVTLTAGTYDSRFALEFAPIQDSPTSLENDANANANADVRKVFVGGRLYIIRDGKVYDAAGQRVE